MDQHLKTQQHQLELAAFERYERRLRDAYRRATTPEPEAAKSGRWDGSDLRGGICRDGVESSPGRCEDQSAE